MCYSPIGVSRATFAIRSAESGGRDLAAARARVPGCNARTWQCHAESNLFMLPGQDLASEAIAYRKPCAKAVASLPMPGLLAGVCSIGSGAADNCC